MRVSASELNTTQGGGAHFAAAWPADEVARAREGYQCAHLLTPPRRLKQYAARLSALYVDLDCASLEHDEVPEPSVVVCSSPGRLQCYWQLRGPADPAFGERLNRRLAYAVGADRSGWDLTQLLRVPGTPNRTYPDTPTVAVLAHPGHRYDAGALAMSIPQVEPQLFEMRNAPQASAPALDTLPDEWQQQPPLSRAARRILDGDSVILTPDGRLGRSASLVRIARVLHGAGLPPDYIAEALAERDIGLDWRKYADRSDAARLRWSN